MIIIDGKNSVLGRVASYAAKEALRGGEVAIINCDQIIITGNKKDIIEDYLARKKRIGSSQKGPKVSMTTQKIVKRAVRGMLPNARQKGRGKDALGRVKCYVGVPGEFEGKKTVSISGKKKNKFIYVKEIAR